MEILFEPLSLEHDKENFDCGDDELNLFLKTQAGQRQKKHNAITHVAVTHQMSIRPKIIYGYYTLSNSSLEYHWLPPLEAKKNSPKEKVPALKLGRLARNKLYTKPGFGEVILMDVFKRAIDLSEEVGFYLIDVDVLNPQLVSFYKRYGFVEFKDQKLHLFITMATVKKLFKVSA